MQRLLNDAGFSLVTPYSPNPLTLGNILIRNALTTMPGIDVVSLRELEKKFDPYLLQGRPMSELKNEDPLEWARWIIFWKKKIAQHGKMMDAFSHGHGRRINIQAIPFAELFGLVSVPADFYDSSRSSASKEAFFSRQNTAQFCNEMRVSAFAVSSVLPENRAAAIGNYQRYCPGAAPRPSR